MQSLRLALKHLPKEKRRGKLALQGVMYVQDFSPKLENADNVQKKINQIHRVLQLLLRQGALKKELTIFSNQVESDGSVINVERLL